MRTKLARWVMASLALVTLVAWAPAAVSDTRADSCEGGTNVPNRYNVPFCVMDDELFIFAANYKPFESSATEEGRTAERFFDTVIGDKLREAFPDVKIKYATWDFPVRYEELQAAGVVPDIVLDNPRNRIDRDLEPLGWVQDMTDMVESGGLDLDSLNQAAVEQVRSRSDGGLYGVPLFVDDYVMFYNKKIFDKFHVSYPKAGMTYDQIYRMAKKLTRQEGLDAYKGYMQHPDTYLEFNQLGVYPFLPTTTEEPAAEDVKVDLTSPEWEQLGSNMYRFLTIPRNNFTTVNDFLRGDMSRPGHVAMSVDTLSKLPMYALSELYIDDGDEEDFQQYAESVDIGVTSVPVLSRRSTATYQPNTLAAFVTPQSDQQATAFQIVKWLASEEAQVELSRHAIKGVLETDAVVNSFGQDIPELAGIDTSAVYWGENAMVRNYQNTEFWDIPMYMVFRQHVLKDGMTVDSALVATETEDVPKYIRDRADAGETW